MDEIVAFAELERFIDLPVRTYSSGMYMRLGFSVAAHIQADVLLLDEVFAVGDEDFQRKCFGKIAEFKQRGGTIVFVSHDAQAVERLCDRAVLLRAGRGRVRRADARGDRRATASCSPRSASPDELAAGLREWGSGEARIVAARAARRRRRRAAPGRGRRARSSCGSSSPPSRTCRRRRVSLELRDDDGVVLGAVTQTTAELGWDGRAGERELRFELDALPLADGRFHLRFALVEPRTGGCCTRSTTRCSFFVFPTGARDAARCCSRAAGRCRRSPPPSQSHGV